MRVSLQSQLTPLLLLLLLGGQFPPLVPGEGVGSLCVALRGHVRVGSEAPGRCSTQVHLKGRRPRAIQKRGVGVRRELRDRHPGRGGERQA